MPECRCWTEAADCRRKCRCRTNFSAAFRLLHMIFQYHIERITPSAAVYGRAGCIHFHSQQYGRAVCSTHTVYPFFKCRNVGLSGIQSVRCRNEQKCGYRKQSSTGIRGPSPVPEKQSSTGIRGPSPVPEWSGTGLRYRMPECRCRRHRPRCRCPAMVN